MDYIDLKYINSLNSRVRNFKQKKPDLWNFSCPICGDSHRNKRKARGYISEKDNKPRYTCFNQCGSMSLEALFDHLGMKDQWRTEKFLNKEENKSSVLDNYKSKPLVFYDKGIFKRFDSVASMQPWETARAYLVHRRIPEEYFDKIFMVPNFKKFTNSLIPGKFESTDRDEDRLVLPFFDQNKKIFAFCGRSLDKSSQMRYINIVLDETKPKLFGLDRWNGSKHSFLVEGAFDSLFLNNGLATAGGDIVSAVEGLEPYCGSFDRFNFTIIYDNEPFSVSTKTKIQKAIDFGYPVVIWPKGIKSKDINQMILDGLTPGWIENIILENTFTGLEAEARLSFWSKK